MPLQDLLEVAPFLLLPFVDPQDAHALSKTTNTCRRLVLGYYKTSVLGLIRKGGEWHHHLCKRTRDSLTSVRVSPMPLAISTLIKQKCGFCNKQYRASIHPVYGFLSHPDCIRQHVINTYYLRLDYGLEAQDYGSLPTQTLSGYSRGRGGCGEYYYDVVMKDSKHGFVPYTWTTKYLTDVKCKEKVLNKLRIDAQRLSAEEEKKRQDVEKRVKAYDVRLNKLKMRVGSDVLDMVLRSGLTDRYCRRFFGKNDVRCPVSVETAEHCVLILHTLLGQYSYDEIVKRMSPFVDFSKFRNTNELLGSKQWQTDKQVVDDGMKCRGCRNNIASRACSNNSCKACCAGCTRHRTFQQQNSL